jgi:hypothetical protein
MTAALIFRRQLVRSRPLYFKQVLTDKLPLEKFHRLLDLVFWVKFLKLNIVSLFVFFGEFYRVSLDPVIFCGACGAPITRPGGRATLSCPPGPRFPIAKFWHCLQLSTMSYNVLHCLNSLDPELPVLRFKGFWES